MDRDSSPGQVDFLDDDDDYDSYYEFAGNVVQEQEDNGLTDLQQVRVIHTKLHAYLSNCSWFCFLLLII